MPCIKTCKNEKCEYNSNGCYCDAAEIDIDEYGECETFWPKQEEAEDGNN